MTLELIKNTICIGEGIPFNLLNVKTKNRELAFTRQLIMYFFIKFNVGSLKAAGAVFGRDHATAYYAKKTIINLCETNATISSKVKKYDDELALFDKVLPNISKIICDIKEIDNKLTSLKIICDEMLEVLIYYKN
jgi:hypothetical protein